MKLEFFGQIFEKYSDITFHKNPSSGSRVVPCGRTERRMNGRTDRQTDRQRDRTQIVFAFRNFANAPENCSEFISRCSSHPTLHLGYKTDRLVLYVKINAVCSETI